MSSLRNNFSSTLGFYLTFYTAKPGGASKKHFVLPMQLSQRTWRAKAFRLTHGANRSNSFRPSWIASPCSVFAHFLLSREIWIWLSGCTTKRRLSCHRFCYSWAPSLSVRHGDKFTHTCALKHSVMVMMDRCQNLYLWVICERGRTACNVAGGRGLAAHYSACSGFRSGMSYSEARLKDPRSPSMEAHTSFNLWHNRLVSTVPRDDFTVCSQRLERCKLRNLFFVFPFFLSGLEPDREMHRRR